MIKSKLLRSFGQLTPPAVVQEGCSSSSPHVLRRTEAMLCSDRAPEFKTTPEIPSRPDLHGFKPPCYVMQQERYEHRIIAELKASGKTNREIAEITGFTPTTINYVVKQDWCKQYIMDEIHRMGGKQVMEFLEQHAMPAAETIVECMSEGEVEARRDRAAIANSLLDRVYGKAMENVTTRKVEAEKMSDQELAEIAQQTVTN